MNIARHFRDLDVYQGGMSLVMRIPEISKNFPKEERFALTDQIRRSSRSVCANLAEEWRKRRYRAAFVLKLSDSETEAGESQVHIEIALRHGYIDQQEFKELDDAYEKVQSQIINMIDHVDRWGDKTPSQPQRTVADRPTRRYADTFICCHCMAFSECSRQ
jgi:four helix bundle protein